MGFKTCRKAANLTQSEVAEKMNVTQAAVHAWETGKWLPRAGLLPIIAELYGCTVDELLKED